MSQLFYPNCRAIMKIIFDGFGDTAQDTPPEIIPALPVSASIDVNSYKQADTWELTFNINDFPLDPALLRSAFVEIFLFQTSKLITGADPRVIDQQFNDIDDISQLKPRTIIGRQAQEALMTGAHDRFTNSQKPQIAGQVDEVTMDLSSEKTFSMTGQDFTAFLIGRTWPFSQRITKATKGNQKKKFIGRRIPTGQRLDILIRKLIQEVDTAGNMELVVEEIEPENLPIVGSREVACHRRGIPVKQGANYWDIIYKIATRYGFIVYVRGVDVVLSRPKLLRDRFSPHIKQLAWGKNVETLRLTRNLGKEKIPRIIMRGYDEKTRELISVEFPERAQPAPVGTLGVEEDEYQIFTVHGISDRNSLQRTAENLFELLGRGERQMVVTTRDLRDLRENNMLDLQVGDPVEIEFSDFNRELVANPDVSEGEKFQHLVARGYNARVARVIARNYDKLLLEKRPMRVRSIRYDYDVSDGIGIEMELIDYVVLDGMRTAENKTPTRKKVVEGFRDRNGKAIGNTQRRKAS